MNDAIRRIDTAIQVGIRLARTATSGRVLLARIAASIDLAWIPRPWGEEIAAELAAALAGASEPLEPKAVERVLRRAWGGPLSEELDDLDVHPAAVTPSSQVHRGTVEGAPVAVKVLRPGLATTVRQDLALLDALLSPLGAAFPALEARAVVAEFRERVLDELDLEHEASVQRRFHRSLRNHPHLTVPAPLMRLAHESVLVSEWVDGLPLWRAPSPDQAAARLVAFTLGGVRHGMVHADPHPDDVLVLPDGRLAILDFGASDEVAPERATVAAAALEAFIAEDEEGFSEAVAKLGWLPASHGAAALELLRNALGELAGPGPVRLDGDAVLAARDRLFDQPDLVSELIVSGALPPQDLWPIRAAGQLFATIARVGATGDWRGLARSALRHGWSAEPADR